MPFNKFKTKIKKKSKIEKEKKKYGLAHCALTAIPLINRTVKCVDKYILVLEMKKNNSKSFLKQNFWPNRKKNKSKSKKKDKRENSLKNKKNRSNS